MNLIILFVAGLLKGYGVNGIDLNSLVPRQNCYPNKQPNCNTELIDKYPELSKSVTNLTAADTWFLLFTRKNPDVPEKLHKCGGELPPNTNFNPNNRLIVIVNPFIAGICDIAAYREWKEQILIREDANVMMVDYSWGNHADYGTAIGNIKIVKNQTLIVLRNIQNETDIDSSQIYLIGHSLGAQLIGQIGHQFHVGRITGIDPAGPGFDKEKTPPENRLDPSDADFVDIWHTAMGDCLPAFGINYDAGDVDFYFNGGKNQLPSCTSYGFISLLKGDFIYGLGSILLPPVCSHAFATEYYKVSINPVQCQFIGVKCRNYLAFKAGLCNSCGENGERCIIAGYDTDKYISEIPKGFPQRYYIDTKISCPYCKGAEGLRLQGFADTYMSSLQDTS